MIIQGNLNPQRGVLHIGRPTNQHMQAWKDGSAPHIRPSERGPRGSGAPHRSTCTHGTAAAHHIELDARDEAEAAHFGDVRVVGQGRAQARAQPLAERQHTLQERRLRDDVHHRVGRRGHQRVARKGGAVVAWRHRVGHALLHQHRADREPTWKMRAGQVTRVSKLIW